MPTTSTIPTGDREIDGLLSPYRYVTGDDGVTHITYSIPTSASQYHYTDIYDEPDAFSAWEDVDMFMSALEQVARFTNISFEEIGAEGDYQADVRIAYTGSYSVSHAGFPYGEHTVNASDIWIAEVKMESETESLFSTVLHELGHALGLAHPHNSYSRTDSEGNEYFFPAISLTRDESIMSYDDSTRYTDAIGADLRPQTFMYEDILALQELYGKNTEATAGNDVYVFDQSVRNYATVWDYGGTDTIKVVGDNHVVISLEPGSWSSVGTTIKFYDGDKSVWGFETVVIAPDTTIENATGGMGSDTITGNDADNVLAGRAGNDRLYGHVGDDTLWGSTGNDELHGGAGNDIIGGGPDNDLIVGGNARDILYGGSGDDTLHAHTENMHSALSGDVIYAGSGSDVVYGSNGNDVLGGGIGDDILRGYGGHDRIYASHGADRVEAGGGNDVIYGGSGDDKLFGQGGDDTIFGGTGNDILHGQNGADTFVFGKEHGNDTITDFSVEEDVLHILFYETMEGLADEATVTTIAGKTGLLIDSRWGEIFLVGLDFDDLPNLQIVFE